jgi:CBS domain-containing protein
MTTEVVAVDPQLSLRDTIDLLDQYHVSGVPVVSGGQVVGVITSTDLLGFVAAMPNGPREDPEEPPPDPTEPVAEWIEGEQPTAAYFSELSVNPDDDVSERIGNESAPVWDHLAEHTVSEAMTRKVCSLSGDTPVEFAAEVMGNANIHRVLVMDDGKLEGIATTSDIARAVAEHRLTSRTFVFPHTAREFKY